MPTAGNECRIFFRKWRKLDLRGDYPPAGTPAAVAQKLELAMKATIDLPEVKAKLLEMGLEPSYLPGTKVKAMTVNEIAYWRNVAKTSSIHLD